jgi:hypothetical protein
VQWPPLLGRRHPKRGADLGPGAPVGARRLDVAIEQCVAQLAQFGGGRRRRVKPSERTLVRRAIDRLAHHVQCEARCDVKVPLTLTIVKAALTHCARTLIDREFGDPLGSIDRREDDAADASLGRAQRSVQ